MWDKKVILTIILGLFLSFIFGYLKNNNYTPEDFKRLFIYKTHYPKKYNIIIAGDSRTYRGVSAKIIEDSLNLDALNLGYSSADFSKLLINQINNKLKKESSEKKIIILGISPLTVNLNNEQNGHLKEMLNLKKEEIIDYLYFYPIKKFFKKQTPSTIFKKDAVDTNFIQICHINEGWVESYFVKPMPTLALLSYYNQFKNLDKNFSYQILDSLCNNIKKWKKQNISVYAFIPPSSDKMEVLENNLFQINRGKVIKQLINSGVKWIRLDSLYFSYDGSHLCSKSAKILSKEIAFKIKRNLCDSVFYPEKSYTANYDSAKTKIILKPNVFKSDTLYETNNMFVELEHSTAEKYINNSIKKVVAYSKIQYTDSLMPIQFCMEINRNNKHLFYKSYTPLYCLPDRVCTARAEFFIPDNISINKNDEIKIYIYNPQKSEIRVGDMEILLSSYE